MISRCAPEPWGFSSCTVVAVFISLQNSFLGEGLSSRIEEHLGKKAVHLYRNTRHRILLDPSRYDLGPRLLQGGGTPEQAPCYFAFSRCFGYVA